MMRHVQRGLFLHVFICSRPQKSKNSACERMQLCPGIQQYLYAPLYRLLSRKRDRYHTFLSVLNMDSACFRIIHGFTRTQNLNANLFLSFLLFFPLRVELAPDEPELFFISRPRPSGHVRNGHAATSRGEE